MNYTGFLNVYKERGMTSMDVCARIRRILHVDKVGHAGTLDPMAEGVLPVALGRACKSVTQAGEAGKVYEAGMLLGVVTDTQDITGTVLSEYTGPLPGEDRIKEVIYGFQGGYEQLTPMYSARQVDGKRLYDLARQGMEVERSSHWIDITDIEVLSIDGPHVKFRVSCSKGTYVRTICHDIGQKLGCGACMESLLRTKVGDFCLEDALHLEDVRHLEKEHAVDGALRVITPTAIAIGKFDGTHLGHQALLRELRKTAEKERLRSLVLVLSLPGKQIESEQQHRERLLSMGIDYVIFLPLSREIMQMSAEEFLQKILIERYSMHTLVGGKDISFGYQKQGNAGFLKENAKRLGIRYKLIDKIRLCEDDHVSEEPDTEYSSTLLREKLSEGDMESVKKVMGQNYMLEGTTVAGNHIGTDVLQRATANLSVSEDLQLPPMGVYVTRVHLMEKPDRKYRNDLTAPKRQNDRVYYGISNLGYRPTVEEQQKQLNLETHIFDLPGEEADRLYGKPMQVEFLHFLRPEQKFSSLEELKKQIDEIDLPQARAYLAGCQPGSPFEQ